MNIEKQSSLNPYFTRQLVEEIANHKGIDPEAPDFCLYEETDPEALEICLANTNGPVTVEFPIDDVTVSITKTTEGEITIDVESKAKPALAADD